MNLFENRSALPTLSAEQILFGSDPTPRLVAVEIQESRALLYFREAEGVRRVEEPFQPWLIAEKKIALPEAEWTQLQGGRGEGGAAASPSLPLQVAKQLKLRWLARFPSWSSFNRARHLLRDQHLEAIAYTTPTRQYLLATGKTLFKGMTFNEVHRLQLDLETEALDPHCQSNRILLIALSDNRGFEEVLEGEEAEIIRRLVRLVQERDPDVIEGHNLFGFDLRYLEVRARRLGIPLEIGRDGSPLVWGAERQCAIGANTRPFSPGYVHGRHLLDTYLAVQRFDWARGELESYGLKEVAQVLRIAEPNRIYPDRAELATLWRNEPATVRQYALQDCRETRRLAEIVLPTEFYQTQMVPDSYQNVATMGTGEKINLLFLRAYLRLECAIPTPQAPREYPGGYTEVRCTGRIERVVKADVESLYPSIMLTFGIKPTSDYLQVFLPALKELTERRLHAKAQAKKSTGVKAAYWDGLQNSFKTLVNSFYGYLGAPFNFNDYDAAEQVTLKGQQIVKQIASTIETLGGRVIEIDTDGVYFQPPAGIETQQEEEAFVAQVAARLPQGIRLVHEGRYRAMLSLKIKNYVLVTYDGQRIFKGASLRSRADEPFGREFIAKAIDWLLQQRPEAVAEEYRRLAEAIAKGKLPITQLARRERITEKTAQANKRLRPLARRFKIGDYISVYQKRDGTVGLVEEYAGDEDRDYYIEKLYKFASRLQELFGEQFDSLFPKPGAPGFDPKQPSLFDENS